MTSKTESQSSSTFKSELKAQWAGFSKSYKDDMFKRDCVHFKLNNLLNKNDLSPFLNHFRSRYYEKYLACFLELQSDSLTWPGVTWHQVFNIFRKMPIYNNSFSIGNVDQIFKDANLVEDIKESRADVTLPQALLRYQFFEFIMRVAIERYLFSLEAGSAIEALDELSAAFFTSFKGDFERRSREFRDHKILGDRPLMEEVEKRYGDLKLAYNLVKGERDQVSIDAIRKWINSTDMVIGEGLLWSIVSGSKVPVKAEIYSKEEGNIS